MRSSRTRTSATSSGPAAPARWPLITLDNGFDHTKPNTFGPASLAEEIRLMLGEGVVAAAEDIDLCMIMGAGWPFHLGGITPYLDRSGIAEKVNASRFRPAPGLTSGLPGAFSGLLTESAPRRHRRPGRGTSSVTADPARLSCLRSSPTLSLTCG
jgi:hypothetical protein